MKMIHGFLAILILSQLAWASPEKINCASVVAPPFSYSDYFLSKVKEVHELDRTAVRASLLRMQISMLATSKGLTYLPMSQLRPIHPIKRAEAVKKLEQRAMAFKNFLDLNQATKISDSQISAVLPSRTSIRVINSVDGGYVVFDGNGRLEAIKRSTDKDLLLEVDYYESFSALLQSNLRKLLDSRFEQDSP